MGVKVGDSRSTPVEKSRFDNRTRGSAIALPRNHTFDLAVCEAGYLRAVTTGKSTSVRNTLLK